MNNHPVMFKSIQGVLKICWEFECKQPLVIRNGQKLNFVNRQRSNRVNNGDQTEMEVAELNYSYWVEDEQLVAYYKVPASSIRGVLRSYVIDNLIPPGERKFFSKMDDVDSSGFKSIVEEDGGYANHLISLFGFALDSRIEELDMGNAGRITFETTKFIPNSNLHEDLGTFEDDRDHIPGQATRALRVRNPIDRITHASKNGGLHRFIEFKRGERFKVIITIKDPTMKDLGIIGLWEREINEGIIRFGALSSIGRGRMEIVGKSYDFWQIPTAHLFPQKVMEELEQVETKDPGEVLEGIWDHFRIPSELPMASIDDLS